MFAIDTSYHSVSRSKSRSHLIAALLAFNAETSNVNVGDAGEKLAISLLQDAGYKAFKPSEKRAGDIHAICRATGELHKVEVKTSTYSPVHKRWQFCLKKHHKTDCQHSDFVLFILIAKSRVYTFLVPSAFLGSISQFAIASRPEAYKGRIAPFFNRGNLSFESASTIHGLMLQ